MKKSPFPVRLLFVLILILMGALSVKGIEAQEGFQGLSARLWEAQDGLPDQTVNALAQTPDGSLWIGTEGGLVRFDGVQFSSYGHEVVPGGIDREVNALLVSRSGDLWIGTEGGGVIRYSQHRFKGVPVRGSQQDLFVRTIYQDRAGAIWVGADQGLYRVEGNSLQPIHIAPTLPPLFVRSIVQDAAGHIWVGGTQLLEFSSNRFMRSYPLPDGPARSIIMTMHVAHDGTLWLGMRSGLYVMREEGHIEIAYGLTEPIDSIGQDSSGTLWIGSDGQGLYYVRNAHLSHIDIKQLPSRTVQVTFTDRDKNLWLGTKDGLMRLSPTSVSIIPLPGRADSEFETLLIDQDQSVWIATSTHLFHIRDDIVHASGILGIAGARVRTMLRSRNGNLWIGTDGRGIVEISHGVVHRYYTRHGLSNDFVRAILEGRNGDIWVGTDGGLTLITPKRTWIYSTGNGLAYFSITALYEDRDGTIWVGTSRGLSRIVHGEMVHDKIVAALSKQEIWSINQDASGVVWIGTSDGLFGIRSGELLHLTTSDGLASNRILQILRDSRGNLWLSSPTSVSSIREVDLDRYRPGVHIKLSRYEDPYSLQSTVFYGGMQPEGGVAANGDVWLASSKGVVRIASKKIAGSPLLPVSIEEVRADDQRLAFGNQVTLNPGNSRLEISYAGVNLTAPGGLRYRYQMEGLEPWIEAGTRRTAYYTHIPPGHYRFRVQVYEIDNPLVVRETSIEIVQRPPFYRTYWFITLSALAFLLTLLSAYRFRMRQMHLQFKAINAERTRIAREMHDTVIQGCVGVSTLLEAVQGLDSEDAPLREDLLGYATEQVRGTIESARSAVWALRNISKSDGNLSEHCHELVRKMQLESDVPIRCTVNGEPFKMGEEATHELLMTVKEALSNAITHADANAIQLSMTFEAKEVEIEIADDGCGLDLDGVGKVKGHYGMIGMTERMKLLGGTLTIESSPDQGTRIRLKIPQNHGIVG